MCVYLSEGIDLLVEKSSDLIFVDNLRKFKGKVNGMNFQPQFNVNNPLSKNLTVWNKVNNLRRISYIDLFF